MVEGPQHHLPVVIRLAAFYIILPNHPLLVEPFAHYEQLVLIKKILVQEVLDEEGIGSIAFCPLAQGLLTGKYLLDTPQGARLASREIPEASLKKVRLLNDFAAQRGQSLAQMALAWVLRGGKVTSALIGASRFSQIEENAGALSNLEFSKEELDGIDGILGM